MKMKSIEVNQIKEINFIKLKLSLLLLAVEQILSSEF